VVPCLQYGKAFGRAAIGYPNLKHVFVTSLDKIDVAHWFIVPFVESFLS